MSRVAAGTPNRVRPPIFGLLLECLAMRTSIETSEPLLSNARVCNGDNWRVFHPDKMISYLKLNYK